MNTKIFVLYHKESPLLKSDIFEPLQTGCEKNDLDLRMLKDNSGDNISYKNKHYGELSAWYWVWKNYLPAHPELKYVGFCHYRRFFDFFNTPKGENPFNPMQIESFIKTFNSYKSSKIEDIISKYDVLLPKKQNFNELTVYEQYQKWHPTTDLENLIKIYEEKFPENRDVLYDFLSNHEMYSCMNFVMKKEHFEKLCSWMFDLLFKLEVMSDWDSYVDYANIRTPAFLAERFFNIYLRLQTIKIKEVNSYLLCNEQKKRNKYKKNRRKLIRCNIKTRTFSLFGIKIIKCNKEDIN